VQTSRCNFLRGFRLWPEGAGVPRNIGSNNS